MSVQYPILPENAAQILQWGFIHDAHKQASELCFQLFSHSRTLTRVDGQPLKIRPFYGAEEQRGAVIFLPDGKSPDLLDKRRLPPGSIIVNVNLGLSNGVDRFFSCSFVWAAGKWSEGPSFESFMTRGGTFKSAEILSYEDGMSRWQAGKTHRGY